MNEHDFEYQELVVPFNVNLVEAVILLSAKPHEDMFMHQQAFQLDFTIDERIMLRYMPHNLDVSEVHISGKTLYRVACIYEVDLSSQR